MSPRLWQSPLKCACTVLWALLAYTGSPFFPLGRNITQRFWVWQAKAKTKQTTTKVSTITLQVRCGSAVFKVDEPPDTSPALMSPHSFLNLDFSRGVLKNALPGALWFQVYVWPTALFWSPLFWLLLFGTQNRFQRSAGEFREIRISSVRNFICSSCQGLKSVTAGFQLPLPLPFPELCLPSSCWLFLCIHWATQRSF